MHGPSCPKCAVGAFARVRYVPPKDGAEEHLLETCMVCGYDRKRPTADQLRAAEAEAKVRQLRP